MPMIETMKRHVRRLAVALAALVCAGPRGGAQAPRRLELADTAHLDASRRAPRTDSTRSAAIAPATTTPTTPRPVSPSAAILSPGELRGFTISAGIHGALAGAGLAYATNVDAVRTAAAVMLGAIAGTATGIATGRSVDEGGANAALFGADLGTLAGFGMATAGGGADGNSRSRVGAAAIGMIVGYPLGQAYGALVPYRVTAGDVDALWTTSAVGALTGWAFVANSHPTDRTTAAALTLGGIAGAVAGDRFLVKPFDHSTSDAAMLALGATGGGLAGAGLGVLLGGSHDRFGSYTAAFTAVGAIAGIAFAERYLGPLSGVERQAGAAASRSGRHRRDTVTCRGHPYASPLFLLDFRASPLWLARELR